MTLPQWYFDLSEPEKATGTSSKLKASQISRYVKPAFFKSQASSSTTNVSQKSRKAQEDELKVKKAWELALAPAKNLPMNLAMSWFSGSGMQMVTISMTLYMFFITPISEAMDVQNRFRIVEGKSIRQQLWMAKATYVLMSLLMVAAGIWKVNQMGLLPTHASDWTAWEEQAKYTY